MPWRSNGVARKQTPERAWAYSLKRLYGITVEEYQTLLEKQKGTCALCDKTPEDNGRRLCVDHDHSSGVIRGLLCLYCNKYVVGRHRDADLLRRVADYLENHHGHVVPKEFKTGRKKRRRHGKK